MAQGILPSVSISKEAAHIWALIGKCGFRPNHKDPIANRRIAVEFDERLRRFKHDHLLYDSSGYRPWAALKDVLFIERISDGKKPKDREPYDRGEIVHNAVVNELTLTVVCFFLFNGFYRFRERGVLEGLKRELVWLLCEFGYILDTEHALFCPNQEWSRYKRYWMLVESSESISAKNARDRREVEEFIISCAECPLRLKAAR